MKKILLLLFITSQFCFAQKQHDVWYFGYNAGVSFSTGSPVPILGGMTNTTEGVASICDALGNILFYTDGGTVWNRNNVAMANGFGLWGGNSSTESAIILQQPGSLNIYYIFTAPQQSTFNPVAYSIVDMTLNGGNGDVTIKNAPLLANATEKITYVRHSNGTDIWIICHELNTRAYYSYLFSATGVNTTPVVSTTGILHTGFNAEIGYLKASPCGDKLASAMWSMDSLELLDFDKSTGIVSNGYSLAGFVASSGAYGVEFSPQEKYLYCAVITPAYIYQYDLNAGSPAAIAASQILVGTSATNFNGALQTGPDGKIYLAKYGNSIGAISNPELAGLACGFVDNAVLLTTSCVLGLPNYVAEQFCLPTGLPVSSFQCSDTVFCSEPTKCIDFFDNSAGGATSWQWIFTGANPDTSTLQNPTHICYYNPGTFAVTLIVGNTAGYDTLTVSPLIVVGVPGAPPIITVLGGDTLVSSSASTYQWYYNGTPIPGATDSFYVANQSGTYSVRVSDGQGCSSLSSGMFITNISSAAWQANIKVHPNPAGEELVINDLASDGRILIYNLVGEQMMEEKESSSGSTSINIRDLAAGVYFIRIANDKHSYVGKFVKQ